MDRNEESSINSFNKNCLRLYEWSLQSLSNSSSNDLLSDVESSNHKLNVNDETDNHILEATNTILQKTDNDANYRKFWKVSLSKIDPESLLQKSLPTCTNCINQEYYGLEQFQQNECKCFPTVAATGTKTLHDIAHDNKRHKPLYGKNISEGCDDDKKISNDRYKHKFPRPKHTNDSYNSVQPSKSVSDEVDWSKKEEEEKAHKSNVAKSTFKTAKEQLLASNPAARRVLGTSRKAQGKFVSPMIGSNVENKQESVESEFTDERLKHIDPKMIELIESEIIDKGAPIGWDDIAGLQLAKSVIQEAVVWPLLRPDIFTGLRRPPKGILLFGPPGTGKTLIGKCVASQCRATFFSISASSLTSKWIGDGEKMVRALFAVARCHQPAVIFIDEIDSLLTQRSDTEHEATRRIKTEFLVQFDGAATAEEDRVLIVGATNRPHELDEAARRRLVKRLYIPLPDEDARCQIVSALLRSERAALTAEDARAVARRAAGYSGADVRALCAEAAMGPVRALPLAQIATVQRDQVRPVCLQDFTNALQRVKPSVSQDDLGQYEKWNNTYGHGI